MTIYAFAKWSSSKILWTCHNIYEHNIKNDIENAILRKFLSIVADQIIVFDQSLINFLPVNSRKKVNTGCYGDLNKYIDKKNNINPDFSKKFNEWKQKYKVQSINFISISAAKRTKIEGIIDVLNKKKLKGVIIAPNVQIERVTSENVFIYTSGFVEKEIFEVIKKERKIVGLLTHSNFSVPTSLYMYASLGIPVISVNKEPMTNILKKHNIGEVFDDEQGFSLKFKIIYDNYSKYQKSCHKFLTIKSWEKSANIHSEVLKNMLKI